MTAIVSAVGHPFGRFSAMPMVTKAPNHIWPSPPTFQS
jgi:hypothetical protein